MISDFNSDWIFYGADGEKIKVDLPHDAMIREKRETGNRSGRHGCFFAGGDYTYEKTFFAGEEKSSVYFLFEGVYKDCECFINGEKAYENDYGYREFCFSADRFLRRGGENTIKVTVKNSDQPNSRWYSGAGIIRPVRMLVLPENHILPYGVKIRTISHEKRLMRLSVATAGGREVKFSVCDRGEEVFSGGFYSDGFGETDFSIPNAKLWSDTSPNLYTLVVRFGEDERTIEFGVREVELRAKKGLFVNGERVLLMGACVHHDNGLLGAAGHEFAEERKARLIKQAGYNAVRSAHNPCSRAFIRACDRLGIYVLDEYVDMWYIRKTRYDYAGKVEENFRRDLLSMSDKDYNSPSVIMYSLGNEVSETAEQKGIALCREMADYLREIDYRPVTCGVNIFFNLLSSWGFGFYTDEKAEKDDGKAVGSEFYNRLAGKFGDKFMKMGATLRGCDRKTKGAFSALDVAGYNYGIMRYKKDAVKYPDRIILGTETFARDAGKFIRLAEKYPAVIGDFVWSGVDYLGEVAVGSWVYGEDAESFLPSLGWMAAGSGRIDLIGDTAGETLYAKAAFGRIKIGLAAVPADRYGKRHSPSAWKMTDAIESWSFAGAEGRTTRVEVYSNAYEARLYLNGKQIVRKKLRGDFIATFKVKYQPGVLAARSFDREGNVLAETELKTAGEKTVLNVMPEKPEINVGELAYVKIRLTDEYGTIKPLEKTRVKISVSGGRLLALGHACPFNREGYGGDSCETYLGSCMAIIQPTGGDLILRAESERFGASEKTIRSL
ncbi:MAG: DUF4982 domain-containing protein [Clostridia bacterium]|nr:DUF4982 domain-containing protein [Clostridia bacterium]